MPSSNLRYAQGPRSAASVSIATPNSILSAESDLPRPAGLNVDGANAKQHPIGARSVQTILERSFLPGAEEGAVDKAPSATKRFVNAVTARRFLKIAIGIGLVVAFGWAPLRAMLATTSVEAIVNARIETIRAPIEGIVQASAEKNANWSSTAAPPKLTIIEPLRRSKPPRRASARPEHARVARGDAWAPVAIGANRARHDQSFRPKNTAPAASS